MTDQKQEGDANGGGEPPLTYALLIQQLERRETLTTWVGAGIAGVVAFMAAGAAANAPWFLKSLIFTLVIAAGLLWSYARVGFEWAATQLRREVAGTQEMLQWPVPKTPDPWPKVADQCWTGCLVLIFVTWLILLIAIWFPAAPACQECKQQPIEDIEDEDIEDIDDEFPPPPPPPVPGPEGRAIALSIHFDNASSVLPATYLRQHLSSAIETFGSSDSCVATFTGFADRRGSDHFNDQLALKRVRLISDIFLEAVGRPVASERVVSRVHVSANGERNGIVTTVDNDPYPSNRRVEIGVACKD